MPFISNMKKPAYASKQVRTRDFTVDFFVAKYCPNIVHYKTGLKLTLCLVADSRQRVRSGL